MPRLDFEKQFARQLKNRELQPSSESWEKLQGKLELEGKKKSPLYLWYGIAASLMGAILILNFVFNEPVVEEPLEIVDTKTEKSGDDIMEVHKAVPQVAQKNTEKTSTATGPVEIKGNPAFVTPSAKTEAVMGIADSKEPSETNASEERKLLSAQSIDKSVLTSSAIASEVSPEQYTVTDAEIEALLKEAIAEVSKVDPQAGKVTDIQIDALLAEARAEVRKERVLYQTATFDAGALLQEVETELEHSFREQVFEIIREGFQKTRNAVVNINQ